MFAAALQMETWVQTNQVDLSFDKKCHNHRNLSLTMRRLCSLAEREGRDHLLAGRQASNKGTTQPCD